MVEPSRRGRAAEHGRAAERGRAAEVAEPSGTVESRAAEAPARRPPGRRLRLVEVASPEPAAWDALAVRSARGEVLQSHAWGDIKQASGWVVRRYRLEDAAGPIAVVSIQERDLASPLIRHLPRALRGSQLLGASAGRFLYAPFGPVLLREGRDAAEATLRALRTIARRRRAALLVIDPSWEIEGDLAAALAAVALQAVTTTHPGLDHGHARPAGGR